MATILTVAEVLAAVETDLPDEVIAQLIETAEDDVRDYLSSKQLARLPIILRDEDYVVVLGMMDEELAVPALGALPIVRFEGTVSLTADFWTQDTRNFLTAGTGVETITPNALPAATFVIASNDERTLLTFDATLTTEPVTITRILGLCTLLPPTQMVSAAIDLVKLALEYDILSGERTGQYSETKKDYHSERYKVLKRLVFASKASLVA